MAIFKCKMCGAPLEIGDGALVAQCDYCGTQQTLPRLDDDRRANLYDRANHFRRNNEFDKAMGIYEQILSEDGNDCEAYWSIVLCRYGIEYVEDPMTRKRIPTVNRAQFTSIFDDDNYKMAIKCADPIQRSVYASEAAAINEIQKGILAISQREDPFDVFICYKETDQSGRRTQDSVLAQELYFQLKNEGFKVFFSRITLEDKLGSAYEPYIFAALNSAKVMVVIGTKPEYFNAVWVKNEWSRYLGLIKQGQKKMLIPAYRDMDPYYMPEEFSHLQAQDMSKLGFMQDLIRGIKKIIKVDQPAPTVIKETVVQKVENTASTETIIKRAFMFIEDGDWSSADEYCEKALDIDVECSAAYLGKLLIELRVRSKEALRELSQPFESSNNYRKIMRFGDSETKEFVVDCIKAINERNERARYEAEKARLESIYVQACRRMESARDERTFRECAGAFKSIIEYKDSRDKFDTCLNLAEDWRCEAVYTKAVGAMNYAKDEKAFKNASSIFTSINGYKNSDELAKKCLELAESARKDAILAHAESVANRDTEESLNEAIRIASQVSGWKNADVLASNYQSRIDELKKQKEIARKRRKRTKIIVLSALALIVCAIIIFCVVTFVVIPTVNYNNAVGLMNDGKYAEALEIFESLNGYNDSDDKIIECDRYVRYGEALDLMENGSLLEAKQSFEELNGFKDSAALALECQVLIDERFYEEAVALMAEGKYAEAKAKLTEISDGYKDCNARLAECEAALNEIAYTEAVALMADGRYEEAIAKLDLITEEDYKDVAELRENCETCLDYTFELNDSGDGYILTKYKNQEHADAVIPGKYLGLPVIGIGEYAFDDCTVLESVVIHSGVETIGRYAFSQCYNLRSVVIPDSVKSIGEAAFYECNGLESITVPFVGTSRNDTLYNNFGYIFGATSYSYNDYYIPDSLKTVIVTGGEEIGAGAFYYCPSLESIRLPDGIKSIGERAFSNCNALKEINIPEGVTEIGEYAFAYCEELENIVVPDSVLKIGMYAFSDCTNLQSITLPFIGAEKNGTDNTHFGYIFGATAYNYNQYSVGEALKTVTVTGGAIDSNAFYGCSHIKNVVIEEGITVIGDHSFAYCTGLESIEIPEGITCIEEGAFSICTNLKEVTLPSTLTEIGNSAFSNCSSLERVVIPDGVAVIGDEAFAYCASLYEVVIPESVTSIGANAFNGCSSLGSVTVPDSVTAIGRGAFSGCYSLKSITLPFVGGSADGTNNNYFGYIFGASSGENNSLAVPESLKTVVITGGNAVGDYAFYNCSNLESIVLPDSITSIGDYAISYCSSIESFTIPEKTLSIGDYAFAYCSALREVNMNESVESVGEYAFAYCPNLQGMVLPDSVKKIGIAAFRECEALESITLPFVGEGEGELDYSHFGFIFGAEFYNYNENYVPASLRTVILTDCEIIDEYAFSYCKSIEAIELPDRVKSIGYSAFYHCEGLKSISIPEDVTEVPGYAFYNCTDLESIALHEKIGKIGEFAFYKCSALESIELPDSLQVIGNNAFSSCSLLKTIDISDGIASIGERTFSDCYSLESIIIPDSVKSVGNYAFINCSQLQTVNYKGNASEWSAIDVGEYGNELLLDASVVYDYVE